MSTNRPRLFSVLAVLLSGWVAGCADNATEPAQGSTARPQFSDVSGGPDCLNCGDFARGSRTGSRLLASWRGSIVGSTPVPYSTLPAGVAWCLAMRNSPMDGITSGMTLPGAMQNSEVIGCDSVLAPGGTYVIDYDASNSPGFAQVAARLTNNVADPVWFGGAHADRSRHVLTISAGQGIREHDLTAARVNGGTATGGFTGSDFAGFALDFVRLRVSDVQMSLSPTTSGSVAPGPPIAFMSTRDGNPEIYVMNADGTGQVNLTNNPAYDVGPSWLPDGKIVFFSGRDEPGLYVMNADGSGLNRLPNTLFWFGGAWSPDGSKVAFVHGEGGDLNTDIYVMNADGTGQVNLTNHPGWDVQPSWSPDGSKIAFRSFRDANGNDEIYIINADGTGLVRVTNDVPDGGFDAHPTWSPDGSRLAFESEREGTSAIYTINVNGTGLVRLRTDQPGNGDMRPEWSSTGRIVFQRGDFLQIYVMNPDGTGLVQLTNNLGTDIDPNPGNTEPASDSDPRWGSVASLKTSFSYSWEFWGKRVPAR
jgi:dipeptidyl aminopeptidase/acylaminoacyl peptidase